MILSKVTIQGDDEDIELNIEYAKPDHKQFIYDSWKKSTKWEALDEEIDLAFVTGTTLVMTRMLDPETEVIIGWINVDDDDLRYVYIKHRYRKLRLSHELLDMFPKLTTFSTLRDPFHRMFIRRGLTHKETSK